MDEVTEARRITRLIELREQLKTPTLSEKEEDEICREIFKLTGVRYPYPNVITSYSIHYTKLYDFWGPQR